jgi:hypothetical protein
MHMVNTYTTYIRNLYICFDKPLSSSGGFIDRSIKRTAHTTTGRDIQGMHKIMVRL